jgi:hypothetical protein
MLLFSESLNDERDATDESAQHTEEDEKDGPNVATEHATGTAKVQASMLERVGRFQEVPQRARDAENEKEDGDTKNSCHV